jgi:hypothetical protein
MEIYFCTFSIRVLEAGEQVCCQLHAPSVLRRRNKQRKSLDRRPGEPQSRTERGVKRNIATCISIKPHSLHLELSF